ncbi:AraC family transcriptional regulator [Thalassospira sp.]|uniref:AraC family transcriptional regulator n=1 Tax=Thalassospira sp. TaxID=1912094 RepID=UPI0027338C4C|nr:AraC family transcriptional regulator [Thalassospira sp.]MDP2699183.1 AraC family transcriptional regulator [Thalassospira sp.]
MNDALNQSETAGLERLCRPDRREQFIEAPALPGIERIEARFYGNMFAPHRHDTYALGITLHGVQTFHYRGSHHASQPGNIIVLHPDELHDGGAGTDDGLRYRMLYLEPGLLQRGLGSGAISLPFVTDPVISDPVLRATLALMLAHLDQEMDALLIDHFICDIADGLASHAKEPRKGISLLALERMERARDYLEANFDRPVLSAELEDITGLDRYRLIRQFRACFATTPYRFLMMRRLQKSRALIAQGHPLVDIAGETGFADQSHLNRHFKRAFGVTPGRWAELVRA